MERKMVTTDAKRCEIKTPQGERLIAAFARKGCEYVRICAQDGESLYLTRAEARTLATWLEARTS
jgi:dihydrodipicolinate synthase/N-acetylneuraminate lyase